MEIQVSVPYHDAVKNQIATRNMSPQQLEGFLLEIGNANMQTLLDYLSKHMVTGQTFSSIQIRTLERTRDRVTIAVGTQSRGRELRFLDKGRREVRPINKRFLRWVAHPSGAIVFSRYSRATQPSNIMKTAANVAITKIPEAATKVLQTPSGVV